MTNLVLLLLQILLAVLAVLPLLLLAQQPTKIQSYLRDIKRPNHDAMKATIDLIHWPNFTATENNKSHSSPNEGEDFDKEAKERLTVKRFERKAKSSTLLPEFSAPIGNVTAALGRDVRLVCTIENLGQYQVAWLKEETKTILSIDTNIIITNYRIFLIPDEEERKWVLHIKDVQESDRGYYQCQVNTKPMRSTSGYLEVVVPPTIIESQTSQVAEAIEHSNISIQCKANGHPRASVSWRRDDGLPIRLNGRFNTTSQQQQSGIGDNHSNPMDSGQFQFVHQLAPFVAATAVAQGLAATQPPPTSTFISSQLNDVKSDKLTLYDVDRSMAGIYVCTASNGIPVHATKRIPLYVKFGPKTSVQNKYISVSLGDQLEVDCLIEAFPKANSYWSKKPALQSHRGANSSPLSPGSHSVARWSQLARVPAADRHALSAKQRQAANVASAHEQMLFAASGDHSTRLMMNFSSSDSSSPSLTDHMGGKPNQHHQSHHVAPLHAPLPPLNLAQLQFGAGQQHPHNRIQLKRRQVDPHHGLGLPTGNEQPQLISDADVNAVSSAASGSGSGFRDSLSMTTNMMVGELGNSGGANSEQTIASSANPSANSASNENPNSPNGNDNSKAYVTVKQTAINPYTYKLRMTISRMQHEDYGEYSCISSNQMGSSESSIVVTKADKISERSRMIPQLNSDYHTIPDEGDYQRDSLLDPTGSSGNKPYTSQQAISGGSRRSSASASGNRVIYDENYLQAIKTRQSNLINTGRLQQKLKLRQFSDRNGAASVKFASLRNIQVICIMMNAAVTMFLHYHFVAV